MLREKDERRRKERGGANFKPHGKEKKKTIVMA
jgi:hypothetical protein